MSRFQGSGHQSDIVSSTDGWAARMGWRYVTYIEREEALTFSIEPMAVGPDLVYVPGEAAWQNALQWARARAAEIVARLKSIEWNRELDWPESPESPFLNTDEPVPGSLESTSGGRQFEAERLFHPGCSLSRTEAHNIWRTLSQRFAKATRGRVTIFASEIDPNTVFGAIELPALKANPNVVLEFK